MKEKNPVTIKDLIDELERKLRIQIEDRDNMLAVVTRPLGYRDYWKGLREMVAIYVIGYPERFSYPELFGDRPRKLTVAQVVDHLMGIAAAALRVSDHSFPNFTTDGFATSIFAQHYLLDACLGAYLESLNGGSYVQEFVRRAEAAARRRESYET